MTNLSDRVRSVLRATAGRNETTKRVLRAAEIELGLLKHATARVLPCVITGRPRKLTVAITANCNLRCVGCRYGRDFMCGQQLPYSLVERLLADAKEGGIETVRLYGGEPLLHPDLHRIVKRSVGLGLSTYVTTNGILLKKRIDQLFDAGLRSLTIGFYGTDQGYDEYVQRVGRYRLLEESVAFVRKKYGPSISMQLNFLLMTRSCNLKALKAAWNFATRYDLDIEIDLIHYSLPYFTEGPNRELQFRESDRDVIEEFVARLIELKVENPKRIKESMASILSIPDWLTKGADMRVPCDAHKLLWVGADGTVQLCYVTFTLGNLHSTRLRDMLFTAEHHSAARDAFALRCPNCHCEREHRISKHLPSRLKYRTMVKEVPNTLRTSKKFDHIGEVS